jgi:hypothetical protein
MQCDFGCSKPAIKTFKTGRSCCSTSTSKCPAMKERNNSKLRGKYDWDLIQEYYDAGYSQRDIRKKFNISSGTIHGAVKDKKLIGRDRKSAVALARSQGKGKMSEAALKKSAVRARLNIIKRYENGWMPKAGRCKKYKHISPIAGEVYLDGTWELAVATWLDNKKYNWKRNTKRFQYLNLKNQISYYTPDFWVEELNGYLEIKGYETELDRCKWKQFSETLTIWKKKELKKFGMIP